MQRGHVVGTKKERPQSQDWYRIIEAETLRRLDAEAAAQPPQPPEDACSA